MEAINRETFNRWAQKNNWIQVNEVATPNGRQYTFITPSGTTPIIVFDLKGNLTAVGQPVPQTQPLQAPLNIAKPR